MLCIAMSGAPSRLHVYGGVTYWQVCIKVTVINFTVTMFGLEDQLLGAVVKKERPDIETKKNRLVVSMASDKKQLQVCRTVPSILMARYETGCSIETLM